MIINLDKLGNLPSIRQPERKNKNFPKALVIKFPLFGTVSPIDGIFISFLIVEFLIESLTSFVLFKEKIFLIN